MSKRKSFEEGVERNEHINELVEKTNQLYLAQCLNDISWTALQTSG